MRSLCDYCTADGKQPVVYQLGRDFTDPGMISRTANSCSVVGSGHKAEYAQSCEDHLADAIEDLQSQGLLAKLELDTRFGLGRFGYASVRTDPVRSLLTSDLFVRLYKGGNGVAEVDETGSVVIDVD